MTYTPATARPASTTPPTPPKKREEPRTATHHSQKPHAGSPSLGALAEMAYARPRGPRNLGERLGAGRTSSWVLTRTVRPARTTPTAPPKGEEPRGTAQRRRKTSRWVLIPGALTEMTYVPGAACDPLVQRRRSQSRVAR